MTEIPEHLLKRSQAAKAKATGAPAPAADQASGEAAPSAAVEAATPAAPAAAAKAAAPAKAAPAPPPVKPDPPYIAAAKSRKRIPFWAMATLSIMPLWVFMYARSLTPTEATIEGPIGNGGPIYAANCSGCHGGAGEGGPGYPFAAGEVLKTFPHIEDQLAFVYSGSVKYANAGIDIYGDPDRAGGAHITLARGQMPAQGPSASGSLSELEILEVVCHERYTLGGADPAGDQLEEYEQWCSPEAPAFEGLETGELTFDNIADELDGVIPVGTEPRPGSPASD